MDNNRSYILYMFAMGLIVPLVVIVVSYASILRVVRKVVFVLSHNILLCAVVYFMQFVWLKIT